MSQGLFVMKHWPGVGHLVELAARSKLVNLRIYHDDATAVLNQCIPDHSLSRVQIFFPDPWPKRKHHKRRLIDRSFLDQITPKLVPGCGELHLVTDWDDYAAQIERELAAYGHFRRVDTGMGRHPSKYEKRARALGHLVHEFIFRLDPPPG